MRLPQVLDELNDAVMMIDPRTNRVADANSKSCAMLGYSRDELISVAVSAIHPDEMQEFKTFALSVQAEGIGWTDELTCLTKSGDVLVAEISASILVIDGTSWMIAVVRPVSESRLYTRHIKARKDLAVIEGGNRLAREIHDAIGQSLAALHQSAALRVIQEALSNVINHSNAKTVAGPI